MPEIKSDKPIKEVTCVPKLNLLNLHTYNLEVFDCEEFEYSEEVSEDSVTDIIRKESRHIKLDEEEKNKSGEGK